MIKNYLHKVNDYVAENGKKSVRFLAEKLGYSKSAIHRHQKKLERRSSILGAEFFETENGQNWVFQFIIASILVFGIICGVGSDRISLFMSLLGLNYFAAVSASSLRKLENKLDELIFKYKDQYDKMVKEKASDLEITPGADETYLSEIMYLVLMDLKSGYIFTEEIQTSRNHETWEKVSTPWILKFKKIRCFLSDKAQALLKLSKITFKASRIPDLFHMMHDVSKVMKFSFYRLQKSIESEINELTKKAYKTLKIKNKLTELKDKLSSVLSDQLLYQKHLRRLSLALHPFKILSNQKQTTSEVTTKMQSSLSVIKNIKEKYSISDKRNKLKRVEKEIPESSKQIDEWWNWVDSSLDHLDITNEFKDWLINYLLPMRYWKQQIKKTKSRIIKQFYKLSYKKAEYQFNNHELSKLYDIDDLYLKWADNMIEIFIRTTSAIEGRNGWLSQMHFNGRGLSSKRLLSQTAIKNYFITRHDGTTACERLSGIKPKCLFKYLVESMEPLAQPRIGKNMKPPPNIMDIGVPA